MVEDEAAARLTRSVRERALALGLTRVGVAPAAAWPEGRGLLEWLARGRAGTMSWLARSADKRADVRRFFPEARAVLCAALSYHTDRPLSTDPRAAGRGWIARYAWGRDYHRVLEKKLRKLARAVREDWPGARCAVRVDTGPILERAAAARAGIGWIGKNTCVIDRGAGSFLFLGEIVTTAPLVPDRPEADHCGTCTRCLDACPTGAIVEPYALDARACIAYLTIEHEGAIAEDLRPRMGTHVFGCDICQDVCPWNRDAPRDAPADFAPRPGREAPPLDALLETLLSDFEGFTAASALGRADLPRWLRNVAVAMGNAGEPRFEPALRRLAIHSDAIVREHARWALERMGGRRAD
jgi:epoxyqueuosine reductase